MITQYLIKAGFFSLIQRNHVDDKCALIFTCTQYAVSVNRYVLHLYNVSCLSIQSATLSEHTLLPSLLLTDWRLADARLYCKDGCCHCGCTVVRWWCWAADVAVCVYLDNMWCWMTFRMMMMMTKSSVMRTWRRACLDRRLHRQTIVMSVNSRRRRIITRNWRRNCSSGSVRHQLIRPPRRLGDSLRRAEGPRLSGVGSWGWWGMNMHRRQNVSLTTRTSSAATHRHDHLASMSVQRHSRLNPRVARGISMGTVVVKCNPWNMVNCCVVNCGIVL